MRNVPATFVWTSSALFDLLSLFCVVQFVSRVGVLMGALHCWNPTLKLGVGIHVLGSAECVHTVVQHYTIPRVYQVFLKELLLLHYAIQQLSFQSIYPMCIFVELAYQINKYILEYWIWVSIRKWGQ